MKSFGVCVGLVLGLGSLPALAAPATQIAQAAPSAPATASPPAAAPAATAPSAAAAAPAKSKIAKAKVTSGKKVPSVIHVENKRTVTLKSLQIALSGGQGKLVGKLAKEVAGGKNARIALKGAKGCEYDVKWEFEDATDESTADLCNDPRIVLTD